jgi:BlaI family penicillinase repressor
MNKSSHHRLGTLQLRIMKVLWGRSEATVAQVLEAVSSDSEFAYTTVATMLRKMEVKGLVKHRVFNRTFIYKAAIGEQEVTKSMSNDFLDRLFEGSLSDMVSHLLTSRDVSDDELATLEAVIRNRRTKK